MNINELGSFNPAMWAHRFQGVKGIQGVDGFTKCSASIEQLKQLIPLLNLTVSAWEVATSLHLRD